MEESDREIGREREREREGGRERRGQLMGPFGLARAEVWTWSVVTYCGGCWLCRMPATAAGGAGLVCLT